jgi:hypothetical protein
VIYDSVRRDLAILQVEKLPAGIKALELATRPARPGQTVHLVGNSSEGLGALFSYCQGYVRNVYYWQQRGANIVTTQMPVNKGDSGGPMVNALGEVVGFCAQSTNNSHDSATSIFRDMQVTEISICVSELRAALQEMRAEQLAKKVGGPDAARTVVVQGDTRPGLHIVRLEKDMLYRILVKTGGFVPSLRIDNNGATLTMNAVRGAGGEYQYLFTPTQTKEHRLHVTHAIGRDLAETALPYTLSVDQVQFVPETTVKEPQLPLTEHAQKFEAGKVYDITVKSKGFGPDLEIVAGTQTVLTRYNAGQRTSADSVQKFFESVGLAPTVYETSARFVPSKTATYRLVVAVSPYSGKPGGKLDYTLAIAEQKPHLSVSEQLTSKDPVYPQAGPSKIHTVQLESGKTYAIDLATTAFDSQLFVEDATGKQVARGMDVEGFNSRLLFRASKTETYRVVVTGRLRDARGAYILTVVETPTTAKQ